MLILSFLLLQAPATSTDDIVITAERLKRLRFSAQVDKRGRVQCKVKQSSGDRAFDALACPAVHDCAARNLRTAAAVQGCMEERLKARFEALQAQDRNQTGQF